MKRIAWAAMSKKIPTGLFAPAPTFPLCGYEYKNIGKNKVCLTQNIFLKTFFLHSNLYGELCVGWHNSRYQVSFFGAQPFLRVWILNDYN